MIVSAGEGIPGFSGRDLPLAAGSVTGVRLWHVDMASAVAVANGSPGPAEGLLTGVFGGVWRPGENVAVCVGGEEASPCPGDLVPGPECACGFWAYWALRYAWRCDYYWKGQVIGVIQGYGRTRIGTRGCRCSKARIVGLHVRPAEPDSQPAAAAWPARAYRPEPLHGPEGADGPEAPEILSEHDLTEVLGNYYGVPCYPSLAELLAAHPLTADYLPRRRQHLATSPTLGPAVRALPTPATWLRSIGLAGR